MNNNSPKPPRAKPYFSMPLEGGGKLDVFTPLENCPLVPCAECGCTTSIQAMQIRKVSGLVNSAGKDKFIFLNVKACVKCGAKLEAT